MNSQQAVNSGFSGLGNEMMMEAREQLNENKCTF